jgi:hypothetical protein
MAPPVENPGAGNVGQDLDPARGFSPKAVHSTKVTSVAVTGVSFEPVDGDPNPSNPTHVNALAQAQVSYVGGGRLTQTYAFVLVRKGADQWLIYDMPAVPPLKP